MSDHNPTDTRTVNPLYTPFNEEESGQWNRYYRAARAMQGGVASHMNLRPGSAGIDQKDLRVGVNSAMVENSALVSLLVSKGHFTRLEWLTALADAMEIEVQAYEQQLAYIVGHPVTLA